MPGNSSGGPIVLIAMGVCGCGKSSFGRQFAEWRDVPFLEGDDFHPAGNIAKMRAGVALGDGDRWPWLEHLAAALQIEAEARGMAVGTCSALKRSYRDFLRKRIGAEVFFVFLQVPPEELARRIAARSLHYMPVSLLASQLETLEPPIGEEGVLTLDATQPPSEMLRRVALALGLPQATVP